MNTLTEVIARRISLKAETDARDKAYREAVQTAEAERKQLIEAEALLAGGLDLDRLRRGLLVVFINGSHKQGGDCASVVSDAKADLAFGAKRLKSEFFGCKNYDRFHCQRSDHPYGYGPRHGSTVFSIGLCKRSAELSAEQLEDALYVLENIDSLESARKAAA